MEPEIIPKKYVDIFRITCPNGEEIARRGQDAGLLIISGELNATSNNLTKATGQH